MNIHEIERMTEDDVRAIAEESADVKGHTVYFADLGGHFGYSALVFADGRHIYHANDYELHHRDMARRELRDWYTTAMGGKLFTEDELLEPSGDYGESVSKKHYLCNYYSARRPHVSVFGRKPVWWDDVKDDYVFSPVAYAYTWYETIEEVRS